MITNTSICALKVFEIAARIAIVGASAAFIAFGIHCYEANKSSASEENE